MTVLGPILIDGKPVAPEDATVSVLDIGLLRGYGCFETVRSYGGLPFRLDRHLARLASSAAIMSIPLPDTGLLDRWVRHRAVEGDCSVRVVVTGGIDAAAPGRDSRTIVMAEALGAIPDRIRLQPRTAPWHPEGVASELTGAKTLSYGPNLAARLAAAREGFDDALLVGEHGSVLEGPTYSVAWIHGDRFEYPGEELLVLPGVTLAAVCEVAPAVGLRPAPGRYGLPRLLAADEVIAMSTLRQVRPVVSVGDTTVRTGPVTDRLAAAFDALVASELLPASGRRT